MENERRGSGDGRKGLNSSFAAGIAALVFLVTGYQSALFIHKASVLKILGDRDVPDTVFVMDKTLAEAVLAEARAAGTEPSHATVRGRESVVVHKEAERPPETEAVRINVAPRHVETFRFDPNTVSQEELVRLGFTPRQAASILNYRSKGGVFRRKSDFARSYVVADSVYERLEPYIDIPLVDLNLADSADFDRLPGIGGYFASRMVSYRRQLGGSYSYKEQLMDIYRFDREKFDALSDLVTISPENMHPYRLWTLPEDSLKLHPYIGTYAARGIVIFREHNPRSSWTVDALEAAGVLKPEMAARLERCVAGPE